MSVPVILDMDGVLFDSEPLHEEAWSRVLAEVGQGVSMTWLTTKRGLSDRELVSELEVACEVATGSFRELVAVKQLAFARLAAGELECGPRVREALTLLDAARHPLALATSSSRAETGAALQATGLRAFFRSIVTGDDVAQCKPSPVVYLKAAEGLGVSAGACIAVEDSIVGGEAASRAGCFLVMVGMGNGGRGVPTFPGLMEVSEWIVAGVRRPEGVRS